MALPINLTTEYITASGFRARWEPAVVVVPDVAALEDPDQAGVYFVTAEGELLVREYVEPEGAE